MLLLCFVLARADFTLRDCFFVPLLPRCAVGIAKVAAASKGQEELARCYGLTRVYLALRDPCLTAGRRVSLLELSASRTFIHPRFPTLSSCRQIPRPAEGHSEI